jgi:alanine-glyoxylate transaminase / serine-glyoxylate transaminase / serine-pyruvate transaminase
MALVDRVLMGAGPCNPYPEVVSALIHPVLGHLDPAFLAVLDDTCARLRRTFQTTNELTLPVSGTGSAGMESAFVNLVGPADVAVVGVNGLFGERMCEVAARQGAEVVRVEAPWGEPLDPDALVTAHPNPAVIALVHAETSTGVRNDVADVARRKGGALVVVDTVTSLGGIPVDVDAWEVDFAYSGTQKCLGVPPGLSPVTVSPAARARLRDRPTSWYLDLGLIARYVEGEAGRGRTYHHTAPVSMVFALHAGLGVLLEEGLDRAWERHAACGRALQAGLEKLGLDLVAPASHRLPQLTTVHVPADLGTMSESEVRAALLDRYGIEISAGVGPMAGRVWRIGCMGHTARMRNVELLLGALGEVLGR